MTDQQLARPPVFDCPKCGHAAAFREPEWVDVRSPGYPYSHVEGHPLAEHLDWTCTRCGYNQHGAVLS